MSANTAISTGAAEEFNGLLKPAAKTSEGCLQQLILQIDEFVSVKLLMKVWGPRLEFVVRLMLVATFIDDSFRMIKEFPEQTQQVGANGLLNSLSVTSPGLVTFIATFMIIIGLLAQLIGSLCLLAVVQEDIATISLISWTIAQPILYSQLSNMYFVSESLTVLGGLFMIRAHLVHDQAKDSPQTQFIGRLLLPTVYLYQFGSAFFSQLSYTETKSYFAFLESLSAFFINILILIALLLGCALVAGGLRSRAIAFLLAVINLVLVCYQHPFFRYTWFQNGKWEYSEKMSIPAIAISADQNLNKYESWEIYDLHKYYFFLGLSTTGALLLLSQYGPGQIAIQKDEALLPVVGRAQD